MSARVTRRRRSALVGAVLLSLVVEAAWSPGAAAQASTSASISGSADVVTIVVTGDRPLRAAEVDVATSGSGEIAATVAPLGATTIEVPAGDVAVTLRRLRRVGDVHTVTVDSEVEAFDRIPTEPNWTYQNSTRSVGAPAAWDSTTGSSSTVIAIVDSGVNEVADLAGRVLPGWDFVNDDPVPNDDFDHGTPAALVAAAAGDDDGFAGMCWSCRILPVKVLDSNGRGSMSDVAAGIVWATDHGADIVNLSLGGPSMDPIVADALAYAHARDVLVIASAGNDGTTDRNFPAADPGVIAVAGSRLEVPALYPWSQSGYLWVDLAAPGCNWVDTDAEAFEFCGTSSAAPLVSGIAGLLRSLRPSATREMTANALLTTADLTFFRGVVGYGSVSAARAVAAIPGIAPGPMVPPPDLVAPEVWLSVPSGFQSGTVDVRIESRDEQRVAAVELWIDGGMVASVASPASLVDVALDTRPRWDGPHTLVAVAVDDGGHRTTSAPRTMTIDNANPLGLLTSPTWGAKHTGSFVARAYVTDPNGVMGTFLIANDRVVGGFTGDGWGEAVVPITKAGPIRVVALVVDNAGHISGTNVAIVTGSLPKRRTRR